MASLCVQATAVSSISGSESAATSETVVFTLVISQTLGPACKLR